MPTNNSRKLLRSILAIDAIATANIGIVFLAATPWLARTLELQPALLRGAGWVLLPFAAALGWAALQSNPPKRLVWALIIGNALWVIDSVLLLLTPWVSPNALGIAFVLAQAAAVAVLTGGEFAAARRGVVPQAA